METLSDGALVALVCVCVCVYLQGVTVERNQGGKPNREKRFVGQSEVLGLTLDMFIFHSFECS